MRPIPRRAELIPHRQLRVRLLLRLFIYPVALLAIFTIGFRHLRSFVSLADSKALVERRVAVAPDVGGNPTVREGARRNHATFAFLNPAGVSSHQSMTGFRLFRAMSDDKQNSAVRTTAFSIFAPPLPQSGDSKIVFASNRDGSMQIYVMNGDGSGVARLTNSGANDDYPRWSPNGSKILFQSDRDHADTGYMDIYVMNSDGSGVMRLTTDANDDSMAS